MKKEKTTESPGLYLGDRRPVAPASGTAMLTAFTCGWMTLPTSFFLDGESGKLTVPATAFLIDHPQGLAVFDTGLGPRFLRPTGVPAGPVNLDNSGTIGARLRAIGVDPASIRWIINSHFHTDHAGGNVYLPNATVVVQYNEWQRAQSPEDSAYHIAEYNTGHPLLKLQGEHDLFGDGSVVVFPTPGHTAGHQSARVRTAFGVVVLAADCCNLRRSLDEMRLPNHCFNADQYLQTLRLLQRMRNDGAQIFFGHDPDFSATVPQGVPLR